MKMPGVEAGRRIGHLRSPRRDRASSYTLGYARSNTPDRLTLITSRPADHPPVGGGGNHEIDRLMAIGMGAYRCPDDSCEGAVAERRTRSTNTGVSKAPWDDDVEYLLLGVPIIVLTTVVGTSVFASLQNAKVPTTVRVVVGSISIIAAVLSSLQTFLRYGMRSEGHRIATIRYETLRRDISELLALPRQARPDPVRQLDSVRQRLDRYAKESPTIDERPWAKLERQFHLSRVPPDPRWGDRPVQIPEPSAAPPAVHETAGKGGT